jgi:hypothetical protein
MSTAFQAMRVKVPPALLPFALWLGAWGKTIFTA